MSEWGFWRHERASGRRDCAGGIGEGQVYMGGKLLDVRYRSRSVEANNKLLDTY